MDRDEEFRTFAKMAGYKRLAVAVIYQAVMDYRRGPSDRRYETARRFLEETDMLPWVDMLEIDPQIFMDGFPDVIQGKD